MSDKKTPAADEQKKMNKKIVEQWKHTGKLLAKIHAEELQHSDYDPELVDSMLESGLLHARPRTTSGLVDMQRYFSKWREQIE
jgi:hypothetical protein